MTDSASSSALDNTEGKTTGSAPLKIVVLDDDLEEKNQVAREQSSLSLYLHQFRIPKSLALCSRLRKLWISGQRLWDVRMTDCPTGVEHLDLVHGENLNHEHCFEGFDRLIHLKTLVMREYDAIHSKIDSSEHSGTDVWSLYDPRLILPQWNTFQISTEQERLDDPVPMDVLMQRLSSSDLVRSFTRIAKKVQWESSEDKNGWQQLTITCLKK